MRKWARAALSRPATVGVRYVAQAEGRRLNREFRGKDHATNVLTFVYKDRPLAGDIVICTSVVAREAKAQGKALDAHHAHLLV
ncbi:MAG TPA: rRNA maturation RNase YbeY, partial [Usitatibacter sp.]